MTYGEALQRRKESMELIDGKWVAEPLLDYTKLNGDEIFRYYNSKLRNCFEMIEEKKEKKVA